MLKKSGVYLIRCKPTGEIYVGGTRMPFKDRFAIHKSSLRCHGCAPPLLQQAWDRYGENAFEFIPLKDFPPEETARREHEAIVRLRPSLNSHITNNSISPQLVHYRRSIGLIGDALYAPPHMNGKRYQIGEEQLSLGEIATRAGVRLSTVLKRLACGLTGEALLTPKYRAPRKSYTRRTICTEPD